ncbi:WecB/TagA/CpsF family glycosyltransferase [Candidatus Uhrbacteria bacterium]|nr:WecB/TagA/CpsF family glycosyltransferase [Candidatus Uhrbacteria bacterium]
MNMKVSILGVAIDAVTANEVGERVAGFLQKPKLHTIVTPNPEFLVEAQTNESFRSFLNAADLAIPDGIGLRIAAWILGVPLHTRITGVETVDAIAGVAAREGRSIFLLGGGEGIARRAADTLQKKYAGLKIVGADSGGRVALRNDKCRMQNEDVLEKIKNAHPDVLLVALGHVKQEFWIRDHLHLFPSVKIAVGVGGTFDYLAGAVPVPPRLIRSIGLEWCWRLITQPWRARRIFTATIYFMYLVLKERLLSFRA